MHPLPPRFIPPLGPGKISPRQRVLAQWHGMDLAPIEKAWKVPAKDLRAVMPGVLSEIGLERRRIEAELARVWERLIDPTVVAHAQPVSMRNGTLFVTVDSSVWLSEIVRYRRQEILERLQQSFGREFIKRVSFRLG
jgi:predicted nucleic acid-binding Zn ribbon protein